MEWISWRPQLTRGADARSRGLLVRLAADRSGNALALVAAALLPLLALVGSSIDMGRLYMVQSRLQQACDAGTLAARKQLAAIPNFDASKGDQLQSVTARGRTLFNSNFPAGTYDARNLNFAVTVNPDYSINGQATLTEPTTIMAMFGLESVPMAVNCTAQLAVTNSDVMMVVDVTGSMNETIAGDSQSKIATVRQVIRDFWAQASANQAPGTRIRFGFVPYSTNVNVGGLLQDSWVTPNWTYQSRTLDTSVTDLGTYSFDTSATPVSGTTSNSIDTTYPADYDTIARTYKCRSAAGSTLTQSITLVSSTTAPFAGPPAGTSTIETYEWALNGDSYAVSLTGTECTVTKTTYSNYVLTYQHITNPALFPSYRYIYQPVSRSTANWRAESTGCMEERDTYEIGDYSNVDLGRALDLDLDLVPDARNPATQWRPEYPDIVYERRKVAGTTLTGSFDPSIVSTKDEYVQAGAENFAVCPAPAKKLQTWTGADLDAYLASLNAAGSTYHDIGMIWGGRLISPTGLFASENADPSPSNPIKRNLIMLTDGQTAPQDHAYGAYGVEPLDRRRWTPASPLTQTQVVEKRFAYACNAVKNRNITVWFIAFGTTLNPVMTRCAGPGHSFAAANAGDLAAAFAQIAKGIANLRVVK